ncbi:hypothetical protein GBAR_LOCUS24665 [Geodia barretti]|nr:hypothetical protein GBAR_LOCUS24665 [Geodia barretti]
MNRLYLAGRMISTRERDSSALMYDLAQWIATEPTVVVRGMLLKVVPNSNKPAFDEKSGRYSDAAVMVIIGSSAILAFLVIFVTVAAICRYRERNKLSKTSTPDLTNTKEESEYHSDYVPAAVLPSPIEEAHQDDSSPLLHQEIHQSQTEYEPMLTHDYETITTSEKLVDSIRSQGELPSPIYEEMARLATPEKQGPENDENYETPEADEESSYYI